MLPSVTGLIHTLLHYYVIQSGGCSRFIVAYSATEISIHYHVFIDYSADIFIFLCNKESGWRALNTL